MRLLVIFECTIPGPPVSSQARRRQRVRDWTDHVRTIAINKLPEAFAAVDKHVRLQITYYYEGKSPDVDNIVKPIQDGLKGAVFTDDTLVVEVSSRKRSLSGSFKYEGASALLVEAVMDGLEFIHIVVEEPGDQDDLAR